MIDAGPYLERWQLIPDGPPLTAGRVSLVLPVRRADGSPAVLKLQPRTEETEDEATALIAWAGRGAVQVLDHDPATATLLLERLGSDDLHTLVDDLEALTVIADRWTELHQVTAPPAIRTLDAVARRMLVDAPAARDRLRDPADRALLDRCVGAVSELLPDPHRTLLHWDLHYENVLRTCDGTQWLVIDPKPLAGDPGFEVFPALDNRWDDLAATGDLGRAIRRRFDLATDVAGIDRDRAAGWTLGRILQNVIWDTEEGESRIHPTQLAIAEAISGRSGTAAR